MPSYLILRVISFIVAICVPMFIKDVHAFLNVVLPITIAHNFLAIPYSKNLIVSTMKRPSTAIYFMALIAAAIYLTEAKIYGLLFFTFGIHFVFSEVYLMYENIFPGQWKTTKALRISSIVCNYFVYCAAIRAPFYNHNHQAEIFYWCGYVISAGILSYCLMKARKSLTAEQFIHACAFESLGLAFVIAGIMHPIQVANFIFYHVLFWVFYPSWKMVMAKKMKPLAIYLGSNAVMIAAIALIAPYSPLPFHLNDANWQHLFHAGALIHIIISLGMTTAQPAWITRIFHPDFRRQENSTEVAQAMPAALQPAIQR